MRDSIRWHIDECVEDVIDLYPVLSVQQLDVVHVVGDNETASLIHYESVVCNMIDPFISGPLDIALDIT